MDYIYKITHLCLSIHSLCTCIYVTFIYYVYICNVKWTIHVKWTIYNNTFLPLSPFSLYMYIYVTFTYYVYMCNVKWTIHIKWTIYIIAHFCLYSLSLCIRICHEHDMYSMCIYVL